MAVARSSGAASLICVPLWRNSSTPARAQAYVVSPEQSKPTPSWLVLAAVRHADLAHRGEHGALVIERGRAPRPDHVDLAVAQLLGGEASGLGALLLVLEEVGGVAA